MNKLTQNIAVGAAALASLVIISTSVASMASAASPTAADANTSNQGQMMHRGNQMGRGFKGPEMFDKNVTRSVQNITNGVTVTLTSTDAAIVTKLQSIPQPPTPPADSKITVTQTNVANGIQITTTSTDAATVTKLQDEAKNGRNFGPGFGPGIRGPRGERRGPGMEGMFDPNVQRSVQKISNGITITLTSIDAATVTKLQQQAGN